MAIANKVSVNPQAKTFARTVKVRLLERDLTVTALAKRLGLARNTVSIAIHHPTMLHGIKRRICRSLQLPFPSHD